MDLEKGGALEEEQVAQQERVIQRMRTKPAASPFVLFLMKAHLLFHLSLPAFSGVGLALLSDHFVQALVFGWPGVIVWIVFNTELFAFPSRKFPALIMTFAPPLCIAFATWVVGENVWMFFLNEFCIEVVGVNLAVACVALFSTPGA